MINQYRVTTSHEAGIKKAQIITLSHLVCASSELEASNIVENYTFEEFTVVSVLVVR